MVERLKHLPLWGTYALLVYMPFHIFLAQSLSLLTGGLDVWKVAKDFITIVFLVIAVVLVLLNPQLRTNKVFRTGLVGGVIYGVIHLVTYAANRDTTFSVALLASAYNNRLFWYFLIAFAAMLLNKSKRLPIGFTKLLILVSTLVCLLGLLQWVLPKDVLTHFGYNIARGVKPNFFINEDPNFPRVMSTLRDPNSLGAFLIVPLLLLASLIASAKKDKRRLLVGLVLLHGLVLFLTFSRAAWGGAIIAGGAFLCIYNAQRAKGLLKRYWVVLVALLLMGSIGLYSQRQTHLVRSVVFRIDDTNKPTNLDSDQLHYYFVQKGINGIAHKPLAHGPGTAGIVSIQNTQGSFLTENYYLQIGYEVGVLGLLLFLFMWLWVMKLLYKEQTVLSKTLFAASVAYLFMAFVMHFWSNEAIAAQWWLLAGVALAAGNSHNKLKSSS